MYSTIVSSLHQQFGVWVICHYFGNFIAGWHFVVFPSYNIWTGKKLPENNAAKLLTFIINLNYLNPLGSFLSHSSVGQRNVYGSLVPVYYHVFWQWRCDNLAAGITTSMSSLMAKNLLALSIKSVAVPWSIITCPVLDPWSIFYLDQSLHNRLSCLFW